MTTKNKLTLVIGATGKTGRRVVQRLQSADRAVRIGSRSEDPGFDWDDRNNGNLHYKVSMPCT